ncbi:MAG: beta-N-acetylhexosaminidase [Dyadobacter fermentans]
MLGSIPQAATAQNLRIIPQPTQFELHSSAAPFHFDKEVSIIADPALSPEAKVFSGLLQHITGLTIPVQDKKDTKPSRKTIRLTLQKPLVNNEGYKIDITGDQVLISGSDAAGAYYGAMSLLQLLSPENGPVSRILPAARITDKPRFEWRGLMIDCSRTFIDPVYLKKTIDRMSFYKLNKLHLHLSDDQGWRLAIKKYPLLAAKSARFAQNYNEPKEFEGYYSQAQITDLVRYAAQRHVEIIPEIESPGHEIAALNAYPSLSCFGSIPPTFPFFAGPTVTHEIFCAGNDSTYTFFKDVLNEVADVFPSGYVHLGGDEAPKTNWAKCPKCQRKIKAQGLQNEEELQAYFMQEISKPIQKRKRTIAWDEILEGKPDKNWIIMAWREDEKPEKRISYRAAQEGYDVIVSPTSHLYFDYQYNHVNSKRIYAYEPIPAGASDEQARHYLGMQANFWSHIDRTETRIDHQLFPRLLALAERSWSAKTVTDYNLFFQRSQLHASWMTFFDIKYSREDQ